MRLNAWSRMKAKIFFRLSWMLLPVLSIHIPAIYHREMPIVLIRKWIFRWKGSGQFCRLMMISLSFVRWSPVVRRIKQNCCDQMIVSLVLHKKAAKSLMSLAGVSTMLSIWSKAVKALKSVWKSNVVKVLLIKLS